MLKAQLKSKMFQLDQNWRDIEDILTGDFFGVLDYLPRKLYLQDFLSYLTGLNPETNTPAIDDVDWNSIQIIFWPLKYTEDENAEPDIVMISNKWILVIEVKLRSGLGDSQPWREYAVGQRIAAEKHLSKRQVYYLVLTKDTVNINQSFKPSEAKKLRELSEKTSYLKWHEIVSLIERWLKYGIKKHEMKAEHVRMLSDLLSALKRRRSLAFSGFKFANLGQVEFLNEQVFCPPLFTSFLADVPNVKPFREDKLFLSLFKGFLDNDLSTNHFCGAVFLQRDYMGFLVNNPKVDQIKQNTMFCNAFEGFTKKGIEVTSENKHVFLPKFFDGFINSTPICKKQKCVMMKGVKS